MIYYIRKNHLKPIKHLKEKFLKFRLEMFFGVWSIFNVGCFSGKKVVDGSGFKNSEWFVE